MITAISKVITNPTLVSVAQNTNASVASETVLKSVGRPGFILIDKDIDPATKKYAAAKEFLYQATCLAIYMALVGPVFKNGAFKLAKKYVYKGAEGFDKFKGLNEYLAYHKLADKSLTYRSASLKKDHSIYKFEHDGLREALMTQEKPNMYPHIKGAIELGSTIGSVLGLAILAPQVSHAFIHPALRFLGLEEKKPKAENAQLQQNQVASGNTEVKHVDTKA